MSGARLVALILAAATLTGCSLAGRTLGTYVDDAHVMAAVKMRTARGEPRNLTRVNVDVFEGTVYLTGEVDTALQKSDAEIAAWKTAGVAQVVNDLVVREERAVAALPRMEREAPVAPLPGIVRLDPPLPDGGAVAYDGGGAVVATVYVRPMREVAQTGFESVATPRPIDHVSIHGVPPDGATPEAQIYILFWHVSRAAAAGLR